MIAHPWTPLETAEVAAILRERHAEPDVSSLDRACYQAALHAIGEPLEAPGTARARGLAEAHAA
jgi:hypothetical protein